MFCGSAHTFVYESTIRSQCWKWLTLSQALTIYPSLRIHLSSLSYKNTNCFWEAILYNHRFLELENNLRDYLVQSFSTSCFFFFFFYRFYKVKSIKDHIPCPYVDSDGPFIGILCFLYPYWLRRVCEALFSVVSEDIFLLFFKWKTEYALLNMYKTWESLR